MALVKIEAPFTCLFNCFAESDYRNSRISLAVSPHGGKFSMLNIWSNDYSRRFEMCNGRRYGD